MNETSMSDRRKKFLGREDYPESYYAAWCDGRNFKEPKGRTTTYRQFLRERLPKRSRYSANLQGQEQGYPKGLSSLV